MQNKNCPSVKRNDCEVSTENPVPRIQGGGTFVRDVWDILAQAAEEIESLYENRGLNFDAKTRERTQEIAEPTSVCPCRPCSATNYLDSETLSGNNYRSSGPNRTTPNSCSKYVNNACNSNRNSTIPNETYYETCPSIGQYYASSVNTGKSNRDATQPCKNRQANSCRRNLTFSSPIRTNGREECGNTFTVSNRAESFDPNPELVSTMIGPNSRTATYGNYSETPFDSEIDDSCCYETNRQPVERSGHASRSVVGNGKSRCPPNKNLDPYNQRSMGNQTYNLNNSSRLNSNDSNSKSTSRRISNRTFILEESDVDDRTFDVPEERHSFNPHPALMSTPKGGLQAPPFRNFTDLSLEYSNDVTGCQDNSKTTNNSQNTGNMSIPMVVRNETKQPRIQRRVNQTQDNPKWTSSTQNKT